MKPRNQTQPDLDGALDALESPVKLPTPKGPPLHSLDSAIFKDVKAPIEATLGQATLTVEDLLALKSGSIVKLDLKVTDLVELRLNQTVVALGEIVAVDDNFAIRIVEVGKAS